MLRYVSIDLYTYIATTLSSPLNMAMYRQRKYLIVHSDVLYQPCAQETRRQFDWQSFSVEIQRQT